MEILKPGRPPGWQEFKLTTFIETLWANTIASFIRKSEARRLCHIFELMLEAGNEWKGPAPTSESVVPLLMFFRAHSAFQAACALGMGGATVEGMANLRQSLEFAG